MNNNIFSTIPSYDASDPENLKTQEVGKNKDQGEEILFKNLLLKREWVIQGYLLQLLASRLEKVLDKEKIEASVTETVIYQALNQMRVLLNTLKRKNLSESDSFALELSHCWIALLQTRNEKIKLFREKLQSYPTGLDHTLGRYLSQYAGDSWLPFPFMEILKALHEDAVIHQEKSTLHEWTSTLTEIIDTMTI